MNIVTGYTGSPHVTSNAVQAFNQGVVGAGNHVLDVGSRFAAVLTDANTITVSDGEGILQGVHFRIDPGTTETVNISNGTIGYMRFDYVCARYTKNPTTGQESVDLVVVEGTPSATDPQPPTVNNGDILTGATIADFPLYLIYYDGLTPTIRRRIAPSFALSQSIKHALTPTAGTPGQGGCFCYKTLSETVVRVCVTGLSAGTYYSNIITLPAGYAPEYPVNNVCAYGSIWVDDDGYVSIETTSQYSEFVGEIRFNVFA